MSLPRLDLRDAFKPRAKRVESPPYGRIIIGVSVVLAVFFIYEASMQLKDDVTHTSEIRKILRMKCVTDGSTLCSTPHTGGMYVVNVGSCEDVYEFNGIPFTDLLKAHGSYYVPSDEGTLVMQRGCTDIVASIDTLPMPQIPHASNHHHAGKLKRIVWITKCSKSFTLTVGDIVLLDKTPSEMLESKKLKDMIAYIYILDRLTGTVSVTSECNYPIYVYTLRV